MTKPVVCAIDEWTADAGAVHVARELARGFASPLVYVHAIARGGESSGAEALLRHAIETTSDVKASSTILSGHPADAIVGFAADRAAAFVVMGCGGPRASLLGSVSADVSRRAPCPVLIVPPTAAIDAESGADRAMGVHGFEEAA